MILRTWLILGTLIVAAAWALTLPLSPPPYQASPGSFVDAYRKMSLLPAAGALRMSELLGHEVFEVPETDAEHLAAAMAAAGAGTPGVGAGEHGAMPGMAMPPTAAPGQAAPSAPATDQGHQMPGMPTGREESEEGHMGGYGIALLPAAMASMAARTIELEMDEWGFQPANVEVTPGEVVHLVVRNAGNLPHEFMLMPGVAMQALDYRLQRADWNLTEHEAIFEQELILPGDAIELTLRITEPGSWMYMCMFPYHMRFGMMGVMATAGAAMPGMHMGGMKM